LINGFINCFAAAVVAHFLPAVARAQWDRVLLMVRDIANPSGADEWFPKWRHKDWFVGSSWASGIVKREWGPDPHGRNQESISEAVNAYDALALYGNEMIAAFEQSNTDPSSSSADPADSPTSSGGDGHPTNRAAIARRVRDTGRVMVATEVAGARAYWQVCHEERPGGVHVTVPCTLGFDSNGGAKKAAGEATYPDGYSPNVVGQIWGSSAEMQTWFGSAAWKVRQCVLPFLSLSLSLSFIFRIFKIDF
jgi:hypothetical protein